MEPESGDSPTMGVRKAKATTNLQNFHLLKLLGRGSFASVYLARKIDTQEVFALKVISKGKIESSRTLEHIRTERNVLAGSTHPFIIKMSHAFQDERKLYFVLDYCPGGELFTLLQRRKALKEDQYTQSSALK
jgi:serum/glucocorticoid-regulated kinase 2